MAFPQPLQWLFLTFHLNQTWLLFPRPPCCFQMWPLFGSPFQIVSTSLNLLKQFYPKVTCFSKSSKCFNSLKTQIFFPFYSMCFLLPFYCSSMLLMSWMGVPKIKIVKQWIWCFNVVYYIKENHLSKLDNYCSAFSRDNDEQKLHKNRLLIR